MAMYSIRLDGDTRAMLRRIRSFSEIDKQGINAALAEGARESTLERFKQSKGPDGRRWKTSIRAAQEGGKTLIQSAQSGRQRLQRRTPQSPAGQQNQSITHARPRSLTASTRPALATSAPTGLRYGRHSRSRASARCRLAQWADESP